MTVKRWIQLRELGSNQWVLPIYTAWLQAEREGRVAGQTPEIVDRGLGITIRLNLLRHLMRRVQDDTRALTVEINKNVADEHHYTTENDGVTLPVDDDIKYQVIADFHALLSEVDACIECMKKFVVAIHTRTHQPITMRQAGDMIDTWMHDRGIAPAWFKEMADSRNFIAHDSAFYLALDTTESSWDLLLLKENVKVFDDPNTYVRISRVVEIVHVFLNCQEAMQTHLIKLFETATPPTQ